ncbi:MAG: hypothetical protein CL581_14090, partial [Alteromonadaceae bacterium]|nr:hypothetical protein [Alteromonadaceae bacterium]
GTGQDFWQMHFQDTSYELHRKPRSSWPSGHWILLQDGRHGMYQFKTMQAALEFVLNREGVN